MNSLEKKILDLLDGALAYYNEETHLFQFIDCSKKIINLFGYDIDYFKEHFENDALALLLDEDRICLEKDLQNIIDNKESIRIYSPFKENKSNISWFEINGWSTDGVYYLLFGGISQEAQLFESIANDNSDDIYVIEKESYNLLYANNLKRAFWYKEEEGSPKCYKYFYGKNEPCKSCMFENWRNQTENEDILYEENGRFYKTRFKDVKWNQVPAFIKYVKDVTLEVEVKKKKDRLEKYFETVLKYLPGGVAVVHHGLDGKLNPEFLSDGFGEMINMSMEDAWKLYSQDALSGVHPDDRVYVKEKLDRCIKEKLVKESLQYRLKTGTGGYIWVNAQFSLIPLEDGDAMVYVDYNDITKEMEKQEKLRNQYRDQIYQHYLINDPNALILGHCNITQNKIMEIEDRTNSNLLERFGFVREEFFTGIGTLIVDELERKQFYDKYLNEPSIIAYEKGIKEITHPCFIQLPESKQYCYVQFKVNLVETPDTGDITGILTVSDITEKVIQDKIMKKLSSMNYDLVCKVDLFKDYYEIVSGEDSNINESFGSLSKRIQTVLDVMVIDSEKEYFKEQMDSAKMLERLLENESYSFSYSIKDLNGDIYTKNMNVSAIDLSIGRVCLVRTDVTDMLNAEREAKYKLEKALKEAKEASKVKSDFLSSMSHDIRTPMNAIVGMTNLAKRNIDNHEKMEDYLNKISVSSQHLLSLINDVLDMSQIEQSMIHMNIQPIHIEEVIDQISSIMSMQASQANVCFDIEIKELSHFNFYGDLLRIKQILINLLSNAIKFTNAGGNVKFTISEVNSTKDNHVRYQFVVKDTGIGMSLEFMEHLFEPFLRSEKVNNVEGTGLGLSITKGLVEKMGGTIQVSSELNKGTTFTVELEFEKDITPIKHNMSRKDGNEYSILEGKHFLIVEDNKINSEILGELLDIYGATYTIKEDGAKAVLEFNQSSPNTYDAIFMDIQMPIMNGYEATREIRKLKREDAKEIIIVAMTANAFAQDVEKALEAGMNAHVSKPVDMSLLCSTLSKLMTK